MSVSENTVVYGEVPYTQHAFDVFHSVRSGHTVNAIARYLAPLRSTVVAAEPES